MCTEKFDSFSTTKIEGIGSFIIQMAHHILFKSLYIRYVSLRRLLLFTHHDKTINEKVKQGPLLLVHSDDFHDSMADPNIGSGKHCVVPKTKVTQTLPPTHYINPYQ